VDGSLPHQQSAMPDSAAPSTPHAVDVELDSDQRLMVLLLLRPAVIRGSWWWWCSDRVDAVEGDPPQPDV
jgi:hypothetical protein